MGVSVMIKFRGFRGLASLYVLSDALTVRKKLHVAYTVSRLSMASTSLDKITDSGKSREAFHFSIQSVFDGWTCLQLAVKHGFGGPHSVEKGKWMVDAVFNWFHENEGIDPCELEDFLADILDHEFDTIADDGSLCEVATNICTHYQLCASGRHQEVLSRLQKAPQAQLGECIAHQAQGTEEDEMMDASALQDDNLRATLGEMRLGQSADQPTDETDQASNSQSTSSSSGAAAAAAAAGAVHSCISSESSQSENPSNMEDEDGWTVVRKSKKK